MNIDIINKTIHEITGREKSLFEEDISGNNKYLENKLLQRNVLVIGGAGSIGSEFIKAILHYNIKKIFIVDTNENGLAELIRDIRSSGYKQLPVIKAYPFSFGSKIFEKMFLNELPFHIIANFAALKHVRSEKDTYSIEAMFENNFILPAMLFHLLEKNPPEHFFCVSSDKATNPANIMGATKKLMEDVIFHYSGSYKITTARFANVAFSNGSLLNSYFWRYYKNQPLVCPEDINRYFVSPEEAGQLCLAACMLGNSGEIFIPNLSPENDLIPFKKTVLSFIKNIGLEPDYCKNEEEAVNKALKRTPGSKQPYPVYLFKTDTTGEKPYEEFYSDNDTVEWERFKSIGVIKENRVKQPDTEMMLKEARLLFSKACDKDDILLFLRKYIPGFNYFEKGKNLDEKM